MGTRRSGWESYEQIAYFKRDTPSCCARAATGAHSPGCAAVCGRCLQLWQPGQMVCVGSDGRNIHASCAPTDKEVKP